MRDNHRMNDLNEKLKMLAVDILLLSARLGLASTLEPAPRSRVDIFRAAGFTRAQFRRLQGLLGRRGVPLEKPEAEDVALGALDDELSGGARSLEALAARAEALADELLPAEEEDEGAAQCVVVAAELRTQSVVLSAMVGPRPTCNIQEESAA